MSENKSKKMRKLKGGSKGKGKRKISRSAVKALGGKATLKRRAASTPEMFGD